MNDLERDIGKENLQRFFEMEFAKIEEAKALKRLIKNLDHCASDMRQKMGSYRMDTEDNENPVENSPALVRFKNILREACHPYSHYQGW